MSRADPIRKLLPVFIMAVLFAFAFAPGCKEGPTYNSTMPLPGGPEYFEQSSPANVLANLRTAYDMQNWEEYDKLFSHDYVFVFSRGDAGDPEHPTLQQWSRQEDMAATRNLFADDRMELLGLTWNPGDAEPSDEVIPGSWRVRVESANLAVGTRNEQNEVWIYEVKALLEVFYFREDPTYTFPNGKHKWYCIRWEDPSGAFGYLKAPYLP